MNKCIKLLLVAGLFLSGCNIQTVSEYDRTIEKIQNEHPEEQAIKTTQSQVEPQAPAEKVIQEKKIDTATEQAHIKHGLVQKEREVVTSTDKQEEHKEDGGQRKTEGKSIQTEQEIVYSTAEHKGILVQKNIEEQSAPKAQKTTVSESSKEESKKTAQKNEEVKEREPEVKKEVLNNKVASAQNKSSTSYAEQKEVVTVSVQIETLLKEEHYKRLPKSLQNEKYVPLNGIILNAATYELEKNDSAWTATRKALQKNHIHFEYEGEGESGYGSVYIEGINHIYEKQAGSLSGWMYTVNGQAPNVGVSSYQVKDGDQIVWHYTTNLGRDIGLGD